jgi:iron complex transport system substrate-binding protein
VAAERGGGRRVVTLLPAATEIVATLGGIGSLVGVSHECDYPPAVEGIPRITTTPIDPAASALAIDAEVRRLRSEGRPVIAVDGPALRRLAPDLVVTQGLCEVCAVADGEVHRLTAAIDPPPEIISLSATTLAGIWLDIRRVGAALDLAADAHEMVLGLQSRLARLAGARHRRRTPRVVCVEWLEPLYLAGHWVPELIEAAGGVDVGATAGSHSTRRTWGEVDALRPDVILVALCGFGVERSCRDLEEFANPDGRRVLERAKVWVVDGNAYTSRPGPRVADGAERIRAALEDREVPGLRRWQPVQAA